MSALKIDKSLFENRLSKFYANWKKPDCGFNAVDAVVILIAKGDANYTKTSSLQVWLFEVELTDTIMVFCKDTLHILASKKKCEFLKPVENDIPTDNKPAVKLYIREPADDSKKFEILTKAISKSGKGKKLGHIAKDKFSSDFIDQFKTALKSSNFEMVDIAGPLGEMFSVKDETETGLVRKASEITCQVYSKYLRNQIIEIIDQEKKTKHLKLASACDEALKNKKITGGVDEHHLEICFPTIIQSGGNFNLKFSTESDKNPLHFGIIVCCLGIRYKLYCSNVIRTLMVNPTEEQSRNYEFLSSLYEYGLSQIKDGVLLSDLYNLIMNKVDAERPDLKDKIVRNFGFMTGIEFRDNHLIIGPKCQFKFRQGMTAVFNIGFQDLINKEAKESQDKQYALWIGDTVLVTDGSTAGSENSHVEILTQSAKRRIKAITFQLKDEDSDEQKSDGEDSKQNDRQTEELLGRGSRNAIMQCKRNEQTSDEKRIQHQAELYDLLMKEAKERMSGQKTDTGPGKKVKSTVAYKGPNQMPKEDDIRKLRLFVDRKYEVILLPVFGVSTPFHISTIKNISSSIEGDSAYLRINFFHPGATITSKDAANFQSPESLFIKELTFRASNEKRSGDNFVPANNLNTAFRLIKEVQKKFKTREAEEKEKEDLVEQDSLILSQKGAAKLKDLYVRPNIVSKRIAGTLEAHVNGLRFTSIRGDKIDVLYNNIANAFYQPCDGEMIILIHFHLKNHILFGKKKNLDVQFYTEVGEITTDLGKAHYMHDRDDLESEQRERELRNRLKKAFESFCEKVEQLSKGKLEFDRPFRELGFSGSPFRSTVLLQPTSGCLVHLTEWPPFIVNLSEVQFVYFERVSMSIKSFDMVFIFKDYTKKTVMINSIPATQLDHIKDWLDSCDIYFQEGAKSLNWPKLMKTILDDVEGFFEDGGWSFIGPGDSDVEEEEEDDEDDVYDPDAEADSSEASEDSEESEEDDESDWSAEESMSEESLGSDESEGKDWDELEKLAKKADAKRDLDSDDDKRGKKRKHSPSPTKHKKSKKSHRQSPSPKKHKKSKR